MTAIDPWAHALPEIGQRRAVREVRMGWHVQLPGGWELVLRAIPSAITNDVMLVLRDGLHGERDVPLAANHRLMTRTPEEQIQWVEDRRLSAMPGRGLGPVSKVHFDQQVMGVVADVFKEGER